MNTTFFLKLFGHSRDTLAKSRDVPPRSMVSLGFEGHTELFGPHPFTWNISGPESLGLCSFFLPDNRGLSSPGVMKQPGKNPARFGPTCLERKENQLPDLLVDLL